MVVGVSEARLMVTSLRRTPRTRQSRTAAITHHHITADLLLRPFPTTVLNQIWSLSAHEHFQDPTT